MDTLVSLPEIIDAESAEQLLREHSAARFVDVRTPAEFESVHIPGSYNVPLDLLPEHRDELRNAVSAPVVLICRSGNRARQAAKLLREAKMTHLHILEGGIAGWETARKPVKRGQQRWSLERQVRGVAGALVLAGTIGGWIISPWVTLLAAGIGAGLTFSAITDTCGMAMLLAKLPYNRGATCDIRDVVTQLATEEGR